MLHRKRPAVIAHAVTMDKETKVTWILFLQLQEMHESAWYEEGAEVIRSCFMIPARITDTAGEIRITRMSLIWAVVAALLSLSLMLSNAKLCQSRLHLYLSLKKTICFCWHFLKCVICHSAFPAVCLPLLSPLLRVSHPKSVSAVYGLQGPVTISYFYLGLGFMMLLLIRICQTNFISASSYFI